MIIIKVWSSMSSLFPTLEEKHKPSAWHVDEASAEEQV